MSLDQFDLRLMRHGVEAVEGVAETLAATNVLRVLNGSGQIQSDNLEREIDRPASGSRPYVPIRRRVVLTGELELAGAATAGQAAPFGDFLRNAGHTEVLNTEPDNAEYTPAFTGFPSATAYFNHSGEVLHAVGGRARLTTLELAINAYAKAGFEFLGKVSPEPTEEAVPVDDQSAFQAPAPITEDVLTVSVGGVALEGVSLNVDFGVTQRLVYHSEGVFTRHTGRAATGTLRVYRPQIAEADIRSMARNATLQTILFDVVTGTAASDFSFETPPAQLGEPQNVDIDGLRGWDIPVTFLPTAAANDDYTLRFGSRT